MDIERLKELSECGKELYMLNDENLIERIRSDNQLQNYLSDSVDAIDLAIARQSETEMVVCPECGGSGVYQEYDEYGRYYVYACYKCNGSGEILHQSITNEEGHFPLQAEQEYNKLFEDKCIKTGLNLVDIFYPSSDDAVQVTQNERGHTPNYCPNCGFKLN